MRLLTPDVLIIENLGPGIAQLAGRRVDIAAAPFPIEGGDASPIAPVARVTD
jgi:kynurenine formamidase